MVCCPFGQVVPLGFVLIPCSVLPEPPCVVGPVRLILRGFVAGQRPRLRGPPRFGVLVPFATLGDLALVPSVEQVADQDDDGSPDDEGDQRAESMAKGSQQRRRFCVTRPFAGRARIRATFYP